MPAGPLAQGQCGLLTGGRGLCAVRLGTATRQPGGEPETAATPQLAAGPGFATHQAGQVAGDGQAQAGAAVAPGGGAVGLLEGPEQAAEVLGRDAHARVGHFKAQVQ